jgi:23S rRNA (cytosine1962-C5)-methyltransferase
VRNMIMKQVHLKRNKEKAVLHRHPWIFSGAIDRRDPDISDGEIVAVCDAGGAVLGRGYFNGRTQIAVRMLTFGSGDFTPDTLRGLIRAAIARRSSLPGLHETDSYRLIFSEGDGIPGLIVDTYAGHLVMQCLTLGIDRLKDEIAGILVEAMHPESVYERSDHEGRGLEGLKPCAGQVHGNTPDELVIHEGSLSFYASPIRGQKTGFYLDQRDNRALVTKLAAGRRVLNLFSYTGGFSAAAALGGAAGIISVDGSADALETARRNMALNDAADPGEFVKADVFQYLREHELRSDFIILDPPALAKNRASAENACRGYKDLNLQVASRCPADTLLLTCSCSRFIDIDLFQKVVFGAFSDAGRGAVILGKYGQPCDHPTNIFCPETEYLKAMLLYID